MDTSTSRPRIQKQPKLRASCDRCGASKLKCDRGQPECERCISHGIPCVYGVSRKMGKPRRDRQQPQPGGTTTIDGLDRNGTGTVSTPCRGIVVPDSAISTNEQASPSVTVAASNASTTTTTTTTWDLEAADDIGFDVLAGLYRHDGHHQSGSGLPASFPSLDFIDWASIADHAHAHDNVPFSATSLHFSGPIPTTPELESPGIRSYSSAGTSAARPASTGHYSCDVGGQGSIRGAGHDCALEAYGILKTLSLLDRDLSSGSSQCGLDHVLRLNRKASEQLDQLLACPCARSPHLALLYVSVISRILSWYQQAASCTTAPQAASPPSSWSSPSCRSSTPATTVCATNPERETTSAPSGHHTSSSATMPLPSPDVSGSASTGGTTISGPGPGPGPLPGALAVVAPVKMAIGSFNVDDLRVQNALRIQLLSGELRRAGRLIDQLTAHFSAASAASTSNSRHISGTDGANRFLLYGGSMGMGTNTSSLYQSLDSWLRGEHARITNMMRLKLKEFNA
ncbi:hypothetical protein MFIFM68171_03023 [Madurella fahalii]|uniref:Zn(2)-C6 fungal-type domain-containing protein n=1 Tax=Madurella fahalii TaxID=1157608 RepID=A0ABQ0G4W6_9PEZI